MSAPRALDEVLAAIAAAMMKESSSRWYLFGAQAATLWGRPRLTADVDVTAAIPLGRRDDFLAVMKRHAFRLRFDDPGVREPDASLSFRTRNNRDSGELTKTR